jgi:fructokinase
MPHDRTLGGAPANFAYHVNALGGTGVPVSRVGGDDLGRETLALLSDRGVTVEHVATDPDHPTGTVLAELDRDGVAHYTFPDHVAWDFLAPDRAALDLAARADAVCFGTLAQRSPVSRRAVRTLLRAASDALKIYDVNLRRDFYDSGIIRASLGLADVLKLNDAELGVLTDMFCLPKGERDALDVLMRRYDLKLAALTRGGNGSLLVAPGGSSDLAGRPVKIVDTIGAGDAFTAAMALAFLDGASLDEVNRYAAEVAGFVCGRQGGMPEMDRSLRR